MLSMRCVLIVWGAPKPILKGVLSNKYLAAPLQAALYTFIGHTLK